jgi:predicted HTH domain antitoxin
MGLSNDKEYIIKRTCEELEREQEEFERQLELERQKKIENCRIIFDRTNRYLKESLRRKNEQLRNQQERLRGNYGNLQMYQNLNLDYQY